MSKFMPLNIECSRLVGAGGAAVGQGHRGRRSRSQENDKGNNSDLLTVVFILPNKRHILGGGRRGGGVQNLYKRRRMFRKRKEKKEEKICGKGKGGSKISRETSGRIIISLKA